MVPEDALRSQKHPSKEKLKGPMWRDRDQSACSSYTKGCNVPSCEQSEQ